MLKDGEIVKEIIHVNSLYSRFTSNMVQQGNLVQIPIGEDVEIRRRFEEEMSQADQFELMKTFFDKKLTSMKRELIDTVNEKIKTKRPRS